MDFDQIKHEVMSKSSRLSKSDRLDLMKDPHSQPSQLTLFQAVLALIACNIGGGIVGVPFAMFNYGIPLGTSLIILVAIISFLSVMLLLKSKELCKQESYYEIGYLVMGRGAILLISGAIICQLFGIIVVYYIVFADTVKLLVIQSVTGDQVTQVMTPDQTAAELSTKPALVRFFCQKTTYVLLSACLLAPILLKRKLAEIKVFSYLLFAAVLAFIVLSGVDLWDTSDYKAAAIDQQLLVTLKPGFGLITSMSIISVAFFYHVLVFPAYSSLQNRTTQRFGCATVLTNTICALIYIALGIICLFLYG